MTAAFVVVPAAISPAVADDCHVSFLLNHMSPPLVISIATPITSFVVHVSP